MTTTRKQYSAAFKARVAIEAIRGEKTLSQLGSQFKVHPIQIAKWRKSAMEQLPELFVDGRTKKGAVVETGNDALYEEIGRLKSGTGLAQKKWFVRKIRGWTGVQAVCQVSDRARVRGSGRFGTRRIFS
jgi:transposase